MKIKEYRLISLEKDGTFPALKVVNEYDYDPIFELYTFNNHDNFEVELFFFGE